MHESYKVNDPRGWGGDPRRGAAMGRPSIHADRTAPVRLLVEHAPLDAGGYDANGTYFGSGEPLYWVHTVDGLDVDYMLRATGRAAAIEQVKCDYPGAIFTDADTQRAIRDDVVDGLARCVFVDWWARREEEKGRGVPGEALDAAPPTSRWAMRFARKLARRIETDNGAPLDVLYQRAEAAALAPDGMRYARRKPTPYRFGFYLAAQAKGIGTRWSDDYPDHGLVLPWLDSVEPSYQPRV